MLSLFASIMKFCEIHNDKTNIFPQFKYLVRAITKIVNNSVFPLVFKHI